MFCRASPASLKVRRILVLASTFPTSEEDASPAFVKDLVIALKRQHPDVNFAVLAPQCGDSMPGLTRHPEFVEYRFAYAWPRRLQLLTDGGILPSISRAPWRLLLVPLFFLGEYYALKKLIKKWHPEAIHAHWFTPQGLIASIACKNENIQLFITTHASDISILRRIPLFGAFAVRRILPRATRITAVSHQTLKRAQSFFTELEWKKLAERVAVIPMGTHAQSDTASERDPRKKSIVFIGRLVEKKGLPTLIDAVAKLRRDDFTLTIAGTGPDLPLTKKLIKDAGLAVKTTFPGFITGAKKTQLIASADVIVVPSIETKNGDTEGLPVVILEALASGTPCIASDATGGEEIIQHQKNGWIFPQGDASELAMLMNHILSMTTEERGALKASIKESATQFYWPTIARKHWEFFFETSSNEYISKKS